MAHQGNSPFEKRPKVRNPVRRKDDPCTRLFVGWKDQHQVSSRIQGKDKGSSKRDPMRASISIAGGSRDSRQIASCRGCRSHTCPSRVLKPPGGHVFRPITQPWTRYEDMGHRWAFRPPKPELVVFSQGVPTSPGERHVYRGRRCRERSASNPGLLFQTQALPSANAIGWWTSRKST